MKHLFFLHAFQKKSKKGIRTPKQHIDLINRRFKDAQQHHELWVKGGKK